MENAADIPSPIPRFKGYHAHTGGLPWNFAIRELEYCYAILKEAREKFNHKQRGRLAVS
jgi:hypothetical protein